MALLSEQLHQALFEDIEEDMSRSMNSLIKYNDGLWKSEKQARFLKKQLGMLKSAPATAWAQKNGYQGQAFATMSRIEGFGTRTISKIRYASQVFVVDDGGVLVRGKVKVIHATQDGGRFSQDWDNVTVNWRRTKEPTIMAPDLEAERKDQLEKNRPMKDMITRIPGWEDKDILVDFMSQLERGQALSPKQTSVLQRMMPDKGAILGDKESWKSDWIKYLSLGLKLLLIMKKDDVEGLVRRTREYEAKSKAGKLETGILGDEKPEDVRELRRAWDQIITHWKKHGSVDKDAGTKQSSGLGSFVDSQLSYSLALMSGLHGSKGIPTYAISSTTEVADQMKRAFKAKKPTDKAMKHVFYMKNIADKDQSLGALKQALEKAKKRDRESRARMAYR